MLHATVTRVTTFPPHTPAPPRKPPRGTCAGILGDDGEVAGLARDAVSQPGAVCCHKATVDGVHVELERTAGDRLVVVGDLQ